MAKQFMLRPGVELMQGVLLDTRVCSAGEQHRASATSTSANADCPASRRLPMQLC